MLLARLFGGPTHLVLKRVRHLVGVTVLAVLGIVLSVGLISSAGFFAQGVDQAILVTELAEFTRVTGRDPFLTRVYIFPAEYSPIPLERAESLRDLVAGILAREVGLPPKDVRLAVSTGRVQLRPPPDLPLYAPDHTFPMVTLGYTADIAGHMETVLGEPLDGDPSDGSLDVWMHVALADRMGVQIGDRFVIELGEDRQGVPLGVRGVWAPRDPENPFWYGDPRTDMIDVLLVRRQDYVARLEPLIPAGTRYVTWDITLDERAVESARVSDYVSGFERSLIVLQRYLPEARLVTPDNPLRSFVRRQTALTTLLLGFGVPSFIFLLGFLALMSTIIVRWRQRETAILVSRGVSRLTIVYLTLLEELVLFVVGTPLGLGLGMLLARWMARCGSFLSFTSDRAIPISLRGANGYLIAAALGVALVARLWPSAQAARRSVVQEEREYSRPLRPPFWYRHYLDLLLVLPTWYAYRQLAQRGTLAVLVRDRPQDLYQDPMLILGPALLIFVASLLAMRLFPLIMRAVDLIAGLAPWTVPHLALRQLGRHSQSYISPLLLVIVSLSMGIYTLSMARSLDQWLLDRLYYRVGADASFQPFRLAEDGGDASPTADWIPPPEEFLRIPGVTGAARVGRYRAEIALGSRWEPVRFLGIDRLDFAEVAWFRDDLADGSLGMLMNRLATYRQGILVQESFLREHGLRLGDTLSMRVALSYDVTALSTFVIAGSFHYFPTVYHDEPTVVGSLEYLYSYFGATFPHNIWLRLAPGTRGADIFPRLPMVNLDSINRRDTRAMIAEEQNKLERVGVFGTLSVGFLATAAMGAIGLLVYSYASLRERLYQFALLRALGSYRSQIVGQVLLEYAVLTAYGAAAAVIVGSWASRLFVPFFRVTEAGAVALPPLLALLPADEIAFLTVLFAGTMILTELVVVGVALYRQLFSMLRMGVQR